MHQMSGCNWNCELTQYYSNACHIHCIYAIHGCKKSPIHWGMDGRSYLCQIKKHCNLKKNCSLRLNAVTFKEIFFRSNYFGSQPFLISCYFTRIFVHLPVIVPVCYFSVHKLIGRDPANIYLFKSNSRNTKKRYEIYTTESHSDILLLSVSTVEFE